MAEDDLEQRLRAEALEWSQASERNRWQGNPRICATFNLQTNLLLEAADRLKRYREALEAILVAPLIDHSDATRSAYGIARQALQNEVKG